MPQSEGLKQVFSYDNLVHAVSGAVVSAKLKPTCEKMKCFDYAMTDDNTFSKPHTPIIQKSVHKARLGTLPFLSRFRRTLDLFQTSLSSVTY